MSAYGKANPCSHPPPPPCIFVGKTLGRIDSRLTLPYLILSIYTSFIRIDTDRRVAGPIEKHCALKVVCIFVCHHQVNVLIVELKSEALKERHWKTLMRKLHVNWVLSDLNLGQVWDVDLQKNEMIIKDVILVAQGEMALEEFLKQVMTY